MDEAGTPLDPKTEQRQRLWLRVQRAREAGDVLVLLDDDIALVDELFHERTALILFKGQAEAFWKKLNEAAKVYEETGDAESVVKVLGLQRPAR